MTETSTDAKKDTGFRCCSGLMCLLYMIVIVTAAFYALSAPFLPTEIESKGISPVFVGIVFASSSLALIIFSPIVGNMIDIYGQPKLLGFSLVLMAISNILFGLIEPISSPTLCICVAIFLRFIQGFASAILNTATYSFAGLCFPENVERAVSMIESMSGLGLILGPIIGSSVCTLVGFQWTFYILGALCLPFAYVTYVVLQKKHEEILASQENQESLLGDANDQQESAGQGAMGQSVVLDKVTNWSLMDRRLIFGCLCGALAYTADTQLEPIFETRLEEFDMSIFQVGLMFTIIPTTFVPSMLLVQLVPPSVDKRVILVIAAIGLGCGTFFNGPSTLLGLPEKLWPIFVGQALSGIFIALLVIPCLPEMITGASKRFKRNQAQQVITLSSGLFNASLGLGQTIGPLLSSLLFDLYGFQTTQDIVALTCIVYGFIYLIFGTGITGFRDTCSGQAAIDAAASFQHIEHGAETVPQKDDEDGFQKVSPEINKD